jgi:predicted Zn finger-like uncharacterized protein
MIQTSLLTVCPNCKTVFSVTDGQLKIASGQVRCGACLHVFNALENKHSDKKPEKQQAPTVKPDIEPPLSAERNTASSRPTNNTINLSAIPSESIQFRQKAKKNGPFSTLMYGLAITVCLLALFIQTLWIKQSEWLYTDTLFPLYQLGYQISQQPIPLKRSPELITNQKLVIQPHDEYKDAVRVSLLLQNNASFAQPFPTLKMSFSDLHGRMVAQRTLKPTQYIDTITFPDYLMPSGQPIQIQLDFMSPGRRAINYQLELF